jgi:hypothetical protein
MYAATLVTCAKGSHSTASLVGGQQETTVRCPIGRLHRFTWGAVAHHAPHVHNRANSIWSVMKWLHARNFGKDLEAGLSIARLKNWIITPSILSRSDTRANRSYVCSECSKHCSRVSSRGLEPERAVWNRSRCVGITTEVIAEIVAVMPQ